MSQLRPLVAVSLKMYLSAAATRSYVERVAQSRATLGERARTGVDTAVLPTFPTLESTSQMLAGTGVQWGAQDVAPSDAGAQTGEVAAAVLAELGCTYVEIGHAERRRLFGEDPTMLDAKLTTAVAAGLTPLYCVGEPARAATPQAAAEECLRDLERALKVVGGADLVVAYEPIWAIGAPEPAPADYVAPVCRALREAVRGANPRSRVIYGGAAGPGTFTGLADAVDGLFLGRFAHDPAALNQVVEEVAAADHADAAMSTRGAIS